MLDSLAIDSPTFRAACSLGFAAGLVIAGLSPSLLVPERMRTVAAWASLLLAPPLMTLPIWGWALSCGDWREAGRPSSLGQPILLVLALAYVVVTVAGVVRKGPPLLFRLLVPALQALWLPLALLVATMRITGDSV